LNRCVNNIETHAMRQELLFQPEASEFEAETLAGQIETGSGEHETGPQSLRRSRAAAGRRGAEAAVEQARDRTSLIVPWKRSNKAARSGGGGRGGKEARSEGWQMAGNAPGAGLDQAHPASRLPADRRCRGATSATARSRPTSRRSPVRESGTPGSVRGGREQSLSLPRPSLIRFLDVRRSVNC
jgi:hypothetical protein